MTNCQLFGYRPSVCKLSLTISRQTIRDRQQPGQLLPGCLALSISLNALLYGLPCVGVNGLPCGLCCGPYGVPLAWWHSDIYSSLGGAVTLVCCRLSGRVRPRRRRLERRQPPRLHRLHSGPSPLAPLPTDPQTHRRPLTPPPLSHCLYNISKT